MLKLEFKARTQDIFDVVIHVGVYLPFRTEADVRAQVKSRKKTGVANTPFRKLSFR